MGDGPIPGGRDGGPVTTTTAIYAGSFDPFHRGHRAIVEQAIAAFDMVVVAVMANPTKPAGLLTASARIAVAARSVADLASVSVVAHHGLVADLARHLHATALVRSIGKEQTLELQMAVHNQVLAGIPTVFFSPDVYTTSISSTEIRDRLEHGDITAALALLAPSARSTFRALTDAGPDAQARAMSELLTARHRAAHHRPSDPAT